VPKKTEKDEDFEPLKQVYSPGFLWREKGLLFEQIKDRAYIVYDYGQDKIKVDPGSPVTRLKDTENNIVYLPLRRTPWPLTTPRLTFDLSETQKLWHEVRSFIFEHVDVVEEELYDVLTAWILASYLPELWMVVPYIFFYGPIASGKTRGLETLQVLSYRGIIGSNVSSASLFRGCELWHPTVFLDETEIYSRAEHTEVIGLLNSGYRRGQYAWRVKNTEHGTQLELFDVFGFKALSGTEGLAQALESRSIKIRMMKNTRPVRFLIDLEKAEELRGKLLMWRFRMMHKIFSEENEVSEVFSEVSPDLKFANGRLIELFQPLLAVANEGHENIVKYARKVYEIRQLEEQTTLEAMILEALLNLENKVENRVILTKDIRETLNEGLPEKEKFKTRTIGRVMSKMGFISKHTNQGNGFIWDENRIKILRARYLPERIPSQLPSLSSQTSSYDSINKTSEDLGSGKRMRLQNFVGFKNLVRLTIKVIGKCAVCGFQGRMDWQVTMPDGSWALLCDKCGLELAESAEKD